MPEALRRIAIDNVAFVDLEDAAGEPLSYAVALAAHAEPANPAVRWFVDAAREALDENGMRDGNEGTAPETREPFPAAPHAAPLPGRPKMPAHFFCSCATRSVKASCEPSMRSLPRA